MTRTILVTIELLEEEPDVGLPTGATLENIIVELLRSAPGQDAVQGWYCIAAEVDTP